MNEQKDIFNHFIKNIISLIVKYVLGKLVTCDASNGVVCRGLPLW
jgi:hypothetical protein